MNRDELNEYVLNVKGLLRIKQWNIRVHEDDGQGDAHVVMDRQKMLATILINPKLLEEREDAMFYVGHELAHVLLSDMDFIACNGRSTDIMEVYNLYEERACDIIGELVSVVP